MLQVSWDVSKVTNMSNMFVGASSFNQPLNSWDTGNVITMIAMFQSATAFNQPLDNWDTSSVTDMGWMFLGASAFNGAIGAWDVSNVTSMNRMFEGLSPFDQDISRWNVSKVANFGGFLSGVTLSPENYDKLLMKWSRLPLQPELTFHPGNSQYDLGKPDEARQYLINEFAWVFPPGTDSSTGNYYKDPGTVILLSYNR